MLQLALDANVLGKVCHPRASASRPIAEWIESCLRSDYFRIVVPEIADYECRRHLIWRARYRHAPQAVESLRRLDQLEQLAEVLPIQKAAMRLAAEFWAEALWTGRPPEDMRALGADVILAAQVKLCENAEVVTENRKHLSPFVRIFPIEDYVSPL